MADIVTLHTSVLDASKADIPPSDPTIPTAVIATAIGPIKLCIDFGVLMDAEAVLIAGGHNVSLLTCFNIRSAAALREFFVIATKPYQPKLGYEEAMGLVTLVNLPSIQEAVSAMWERAMPDDKGVAKGDGQDPPVPSDSGESATGNGSSVPPEQTSDLTLPDYGE